MIKAVRILKIISSFVFLVTLLYVYSFLPIMVNINPDFTGWSIHKEHLFYGVIAAFFLINVFHFFLDRILKPLISSEDILAWIKGLAFVLNLYLAFLFGYIGIINNQSHFQNGSYGYLTYLGPLLILAWIAGLIFLISQRNKTN